ncbi:MAG: hypothetical protein H0A75_07755 [Candidatus Methanofishera endochildressiae]|uniref:Uncharacterized protein n=1 Tax=Candidatus Methanofishera endochildressiae TaxID=2738884 RepID=A0A7Z0SDB5_9GAMM|nr:hypothetical protein [Candidatus Methanofishera endochildressiae]
MIPICQKLGTLMVIFIFPPSIKYSKTLQFRWQSFKFFDIINADAEGRRTLLRLFYDTALNLIAQNPGLATNYDPRERPWYKLAQRYDEPATTQPYLFHFLGKVGVTLTTRTAHAGIVVAADITLDQFPDFSSKS